MAREVPGGTALYYLGCIFLIYYFRISAYTTFILLLHFSTVYKIIVPVDNNKVMNQYNSEYMHDHAS